MFHGSKINGLQHELELTHPTQNSFIHPGDNNWIFTNRELNLAMRALEQLPLVKCSNAEVPATNTSMVNKENIKWPVHSANGTTTPVGPGWRLIRPQPSAAWKILEIHSRAELTGKSEAYLGKFSNFINWRRHRSGVGAQAGGNPQLPSH